MSALPAFLRVMLASILVLVASSVHAADDSPLFVVHFETGPGWDPALAPEKQPGFGEHSANLARLRREGSIAFGARYSQFGMIFLKVASADAAREILDQDPGVRAGIFVYRVEPMLVFYPYREDTAP